MLYEKKKRHNALEFYVYTMNNEIQPMRLKIIKVTVKMMVGGGVQTQDNPGWASVVFSGVIGSVTGNSGDSPFVISL